MIRFPRYLVFATVQTSRATVSKMYPPTRDVSIRINQTKVYQTYIPVCLYKVAPVHTRSAGNPKEDKKTTKSQVVLEFDVALMSLALLLSSLLWLVGVLD